ncbi:hypothetical protein PLESTB_001217000 [Pleodorina starrii]|uniref:RAP domain-containing protein n=1 Tax=Pleodorina starrii TaxID=330485 RepID=A0A9W6BSJ2_9CHLO|nr:hypothetical protein PLESTB_001217000 [Pleodorina starrii]
MQAGVAMLAKSCLHSATPSVWSRNERRPGLTARRKIVDYSRCNIIRSQSHGSWRGDVAGAAASPAAFLPAQRLTAAISRSQHIDELSSICSNHWDALNHIHVSAALSAAVKLPGARRPGAAALLDSLAVRFSRTLPDATLREVATVLWSLAKLGRPAPSALLSALLAEAQRRREHGRDDLLHAASPRALANILWALATWRTRGPDPLLLRLLLERCCQALPAFQPQDTANVLWALAHLTPARGGVRLPGPLLPGLLSTAAAQAGAMTPQGLANSVWACHRLRTSHAAAGGFLAAAAAAFVVQLPAASPTDVALLSSSLAGLRFRCPALLRAVAEHCCRSMAGAGRPSGSIRGPPGSESASTVAAPTAAVVWSSQSRQRLLWAFASLEFRHPAAVRALLLLGAPQQRSVPDGTDGTEGAEGAGDVGGDLSWDWEPGGTDDIDQGDDAREGSSAGGGGGGGGRVVLGASSLIWCLARLGCGREPGPEQRAVLAAAEQLWEARGCAALSHAAVAAWGLEQLGLRQARLLGLACERLLTALERTAAAAGANRGAAAARPASPGGDLSPGELDAAVMVLWCLSRRGPAEVAADPSGSAAERAEGQQQQQQQHYSAADADAAAETELRLLEAFSRAGPRLLPRLSVRQLPRVCCAYVQLGRSDPGIFGTAAEMLVAARARARAGALGLGPGTGRVADAKGEAPPLREGSRGVWEASGEEGWTAGEYLEEEEEEGEEEEGEAGGWQLEVDLDEEEEVGSGSGSEAGSDEGSGGGGSATRRSGTRGSTRGAGGGGGAGGGLLGRLPRNGLAMTMWALASAGFASPHLMQRAVPHVLRLFPPLQQPPPPPSLGATAAAAAAAAGELAAEADPERGAVVGPRIVDGEEEEEDSAAVGEDGGPGGEAVAARHAGHDAAGGDVPAAAGSGGGAAAAAGGLRAAVDADRPPVGAAASRWAALILWAFAASDCYNAVLYDNLLSYVLRKVPRLGPGRVAVVLWACAVAGHYRREVLEALSGALREGMRALPPASFTQANWAIAHLSAGLCLSWRGPASSHLAALAPALTTHQAAVLLWTLAVQQLVLPPQDRRKFARVVDLLLHRLSRRQEGAPEPRAVPAPADPWDGECAAAARSDAGDGGDDDARAGVPMQRDDRGLGVGPDPGARVWVSEQPSLEPGVALIAAEALALLLASPHRAVRARVQRHLRTTPTPHLPDHLEGDEGGDDGDYGDGEDEEHSTSPSSSSSLSSPPLAAQLAAAWQRTLRRRHPQQAAVAAAARQLGYSPRLLRTHAVFPLAAASAIELPDAAPDPAVLLLADRSDFATNVTGQPLGPLFTAVQLLRERGWLVAVVVAPQFAALRLSSRQVRHLRQLLAAAGVETT